MSKSPTRRGRPKGFTPNPPHKGASSVRRILYTREQTGEVLGGISVSSVIRLEKAEKIRKVRLLGPTSQVFNPVEDVEALASPEA